MNHKGFKIVHVNTRSISKKIELLNQLYNESDILCCSETWLDNRVPDSLVNIDGMKIFRNDRIVDIIDYNVHIIGGGVCIYVAQKWADFTQCVSDRSYVTKDFEIVALTINKPNLKKMFVACIYKPPRGKVENLIKFISPQIDKYQKENHEIWILGDFNIDLLKRDNTMTVALNCFIKKSGLETIIKTVTRPNVKGGSCIDHIMTDCRYVLESGVLDDFVSDHYSIFAIRKKTRESHVMINRKVRDYRAFDEKNYSNLLKGQNWDRYIASQNPDEQWEIILGYVREILSIMCPYKRVNTRKKVTPWLTPEIYKAIREKKALVKKYKMGKDPSVFKELKIKRNYVNSLIEKSKSEYIQTTLHIYTKKPKKFWKLIKDLIDNEDSADITSYIFKYPNRDEEISRNLVPNYLNDYFVNIAGMTRDANTNIAQNYETCYNDVNNVFDFLPPTLDELYGYMFDIDVNTASCIEGVNAKLCKLTLDTIPDKFLHLFANSLFFGVFPTSWTVSYVTLIPKNGEKTLPNNWRPISQTILYAKILEKINPRSSL